MFKVDFMKTASFTFAVSLLFAVAQASDNDDSCSPADNALILMSADRIDAVLESVARSVQALADEYAAVSAKTVAATAEEQEYWLERYRVSGQTAGFQTWEGNLQSPPPYQSDQMAFYTYHGTNFTGETFRQLKIFGQLAPLVRAAYRTFDFSWTYFTTAEGAMLLYPFLTMDEAVNNYPPTEQVFYQQADFEHRSAGWTRPYLDLAGAGMMITVSVPAYDGGSLLGVASHDITLDELEGSVLKRLVRGESDTAYLVDDAGLVIAVTEPKLANELDVVNQKAGRAALYYRTRDELQKAGLTRAHPSDAPWINEVTDSIVRQENSGQSGTVMFFTRGNRQILSTRVRLTGWQVVLVKPTKAHDPAGPAGEGQ